MRTGADLSKYQHPDGAPIDYARAVAAGLDFVVVEYYDADGALNPWYEGDRAGFQAAGAKFGSYVYLRPDVEVDKQAEVARGLSQHGPVWGDVEVADGRTAEEVRTFWLALRERCPALGLWTYPAFLGWVDEAGPVPPADSSPLAIDEWDVKAPTVSCVVWGMTSSAEVPGIPAEVDLDAFLGSDAQYVDLFGGAPPVPRAKPTFCAAATSTPSGRGYWLVGSQGEILAFGDAAFHGSPAHVNAAPVAITSTPSGRGYRLFCADFGVFDYGDARYYGRPVVEATPAVEG
jgi:hypothetical protein